MSPYYTDARTVVKAEPVTYTGVKVRILAQDIWEATFIKTLKNFKLVNKLCIYKYILQIFQHSPNAPKMDQKWQPVRQQNLNQHRFTPYNR